MQFANNVCASTAYHCEICKLFPPLNFLVEKYIATKLTHKTFQFNLMKIQNNWIVLNASTEIAEIDVNVNFVFNSHNVLVSELHWNLSQWIFGNSIWPFLFQLLGLSIISSTIKRNYDCTQKEPISSSRIDFTSSMFR